MPMIIAINIDSNDHEPNNYKDTNPKSLSLWCLIELCGEHLQELYTVYLTRFQTYKIALPPQTKT
jgi:hypothetical protein